MWLSVPKAIILAALILAITGLLLFRYEISPGNVSAYVARLNRLTGTISFCELDGDHRHYDCQ